jgi:puromycin-sensitive aminopeptidase
MVSLQQSPYHTWISSSNDDNDVQPTWNIPLTIATQKDYAQDVQRTLNLDTKDEITYQWGDDGSEWFFINPGQTGFYRVRYSDDMIDLFINLLDQDGNVFKPVDLAGIVENFFALAYSGHMDITDALRLVAALRSDTGR